MEYSPPPLFKQGASARAKVMLFAFISIGLLLADARLGALSVVRQAVGTVLYPLQMVALLPRDAMNGVGSYFSTLSAMEKQVRELRQQQIATSQTLQQAQLLQAENNQLRRLLDAREHVPGKSMLAEILYDARDAAARKVVLDRGTQQGVALGLPVIDNQGVVGQVTRVFPFTSEVTLLTDKEQAIPVQLLRNGLRSVAYGRGQSGNLDLRFMAPNADVQVGDILITSGIDGVYPAGLAVARVIQVENNANGAFGRVVCQPLAGIERNRQLLILMSPPEMLPRPPAEEVVKPGKKRGPAASAAAATGAAAAPAGASPAGAAPAAAPAGAAPATPATVLRPAGNAAAAPAAAAPVGNLRPAAAAPSGAAPGTNPRPAGAAAAAAAAAPQAVKPHDARETAR
ncbi:rod shape-determining protein MreC [Massilia sp. MB5]|uniref:rod shape-determining protein MreC n=1 Tax=unclassified Massilia TaxID=2609279 RepID=UPI00067AF0C4|nr:MULTISPECIES: rod shape-determining protein MreC [unclassified Massilia]AKU22590.1 rod shape-determining protein MreC [Massilia sp. NR 4-1]UMR32625.1 rod shape-determining protein MreC [Massilia sp. MB5]